MQHGIQLYFVGYWKQPNFNILNHRFAEYDSFVRRTFYIYLGSRSLTHNYFHLCGRSNNPIGVQNSWGQNYYQHGKPH